MSVIQLPRSFPVGEAAETSNDRRTTGEVMRPATAGQRQPAELAALAAALRRVKDESDPILGGMLVAGADGLVLSAEACGAHVDMLGVMAAVAAGIASQIVANAGVGESMACLVEGSSGHVAVFPLEANTVLVVFGQGEVSTGRFNLAARGVLFRLREAIAGPDEPPIIQQP